MDRETKVTLAWGFAALAVFAVCVALILHLCDSNRDARYQHQVAKAVHFMRMAGMCPCGVATFSEDPATPITCLTCCNQEK